MEKRKAQAVERIADKKLENMKKLQKMIDEREREEASNDTKLQKLKIELSNEMAKVMLELTEACQEMEKQIAQELHEAMLKADEAEAAQKDAEDSLTQRRERNQTLRDDGKTWQEKVDKSQDLLFEKQVERATGEALVFHGERYLKTKQEDEAFAKQLADEANQQFMFRAKMAGLVTVSAILLQQCYSHILC